MQLDSNFIITIGLPSCALVLSTNSSQFQEIVDDIDTDLTEQGVVEDKETRSFLMIQQAFDSAEECVIGTAEYESNIAEIGQLFIYAFASTYGVPALTKGIGLSVSMDDDGVNLNLCETQDELDAAENALDEFIDDSGMASIETPAGATIH